MGNTPARGRRYRASLIAAFTAAGLIATMTSTASADPAPDQGPTTGGTVVSDTMPLRLTAITGTGNVAYALDENGQAYAWGAGRTGEFADGTSSPFTTVRSTAGPVTMPGGITFTALSVGGPYAIGSDGLAYSWGYNVYGTIGDGTTTDRLTPTAASMADLPSGVTFTAISSGNYSTVALGSDGHAYSWGRNFYGTLGDGTTTDRSTPGPVSMATMPAGVRFTAIAVGNDSAYALGSDGRVYAWGHNGLGMLGDGTTVNRLTPVAVSMENVPPGVTFTGIAAGGSVGYALGTDGKVYAWGNNALGAVGDGTDTNRSAPVPVSLDNVTPGASIVAISAGTYSGYALDSNGKAYAWGYNLNGQLGDGTTTSRLTPVAVSTTGMLAEVTFTALGATSGSSAYALGSDGRAYSWGKNTYGQLGDGTIADQLRPTAVADQPAVSSVVFGSSLGTDLVQPTTSPHGTWEATTPGGCGPVDVTVGYSRYGMAHQTTVVDGFTYGSPPVVTVQPSSGEIPAGGGTFSATARASGDSAPSVQWQRQVAGGTWSDIEGATDPTLNVEVSETTAFRAVFANCWGADHAAASGVAVATVLASGGGGGGGSTDPGTETTPPGTATPTVAATNPVAGTATAAPARGILAHTGAQIALAALAALVLAGAGTGLVIARRRTTA